MTWFLWQLFELIRYSYKYIAEMRNQAVFCYSRFRFAITSLNWKLKFMIQYLLLNMIELNNIATFLNPPSSNNELEQLLMALISNWLTGWIYDPCARGKMINCLINDIHWPKIVEKLSRDLEDNVWIMNYCETNCISQLLHLRIYKLTFWPLLFDIK